MPVELDKIAAERKAVIAEAMDWLGTPFHNHGLLKKVAVDCGGILIGVYEPTLGIRIDVPRYSSQHMLHKSDAPENQLYEKELLKYCRSVDVPEMGDIALFKIKLHMPHHHAAIIVNWPTKIIHAYTRIVTLEDATREPYLRRAMRTAKFFSPWGRA